MAKFLAKIEADGHMQVPDHAAAWGSLKAEFPEGPPPVNRLYEVFGLPLLMSTSSRFYGLVWEDEEWFSKAFKNGRNPQDIAIINQWTFFAEQLGGPQLFAEWRNPGGKILVAFTHEMFTMTQISMRRWLQHMERAAELSGMRAACPDATAIFLGFCSDFGNEMVARAASR
ncbi:MAG: hypothetical protein Q8P67_22125 [archaeon]|nr:hypothetical protein [archaeon]